MFIIFVSPSEYDITQETCKYVANEKHIQQMVVHLASKYPNTPIYISRVFEKVMTKVDVSLTHFIINDKNEVIPK